MSLHVVVTGVAGSGKTTVGKLLAQRLNCPYAEADDFHSAANVAKMAAGIPLDDADRAPWLEALSRWLDAQPGDAVMTCSALKRAYRERFHRAQLVFLQVPRDVLAGRLRERVGHFMPASLLGSQLATLEEPSPDEHVITLDATLPVEVLIDTILRRLEDRVAPPQRSP
jgi:gluconokinase